MDLKNAVKIIKKVERDYDFVANEWNTHRSFVRASQIKIAKQIKSGQSVLDVGCGNGVFYPALAHKSINYTGLDISKKLLALARQKAQKIKGKARAKFIKGDVIRLPFINNQFDWVCAFAVLHHIPSEELRSRSAREIWRVLKPDGKVIVTVWNLFSDFAEKKFGVSGQLRRDAAGENDVLIPWKGTPGKIVQRYLHAFTKKELVQLFKDAGFRNVSAYYAIKKTGKKAPSIKGGKDLVLIARK